MDAQDFDIAVVVMARQQARRLRELGFAAAAAEVDALLPEPGVVAEEGIKPSWR
ncbi:MAG: hypothetical protein ABI047_14470 [Jatrophihabitantaceae bacterium]